MPFIPDFADPRYLNEVGWFLYREKYGYNHFTRSYAEERLVWSQMFLEEVLALCGRDPRWLKDKTVVSIGCGCSGDLAVWPAAAKVGVDPLLYVYQKLGMYAFVEMLVFLAILLVGYAYVWVKGDLDWDKPEPEIPVLPKARQPKIPEVA